MTPLSIDASLVRAWATQFNRQHRDASTDASLRRLRFAVVFILGVLLFVTGRAFAETNADAPTSKPDAVIDLATKEGVDLVKGQWRYSDTKIIQVDFKAAGADNQAAIPIEKDALAGPQPIDILARVSARTGEPDRAIAALQKLLSIPYNGALASGVPLAPALLRLDPMFDPLRNDPRFQKLVASPAPKAENK